MLHAANAGTSWDKDEAWDMVRIEAARACDSRSALCASASREARLRAARHRPRSMAGCAPGQTRAKQSRERGPENQSRNEDHGGKRATQASWGSRPCGAAQAISLSFGHCKLAVSPPTQRPLRFEAQLDAVMGLAPSKG
jgi:hypothetical protein